MPTQKTVLFVGAGRHQRRAIAQAKARGLRVVAVDRNPDALGFELADVAETVDFQDLAGVIEVGRREGVDGALTISADRAVPIVAGVAEELGLPGIGTKAARLLTHKIEMRRALAEAGVPQPDFAAVHDEAEARAAAESVGFAAVLKPADSGGQRGIFRVDSLDELLAHLPEALTESRAGEAIVERFHEGLELNGMSVVRGDEVIPLTLSDRLRPPGIGFGVGWQHVYPPTLSDAQVARADEVATAAIEALGLTNAIAFPQVLVCDDDEVRVVEVAARIPGGQMADLVRHAVGIDLVEVQLRLALGEELPDEVVKPQRRQPLTIKFFTAQPGPLPTGKVKNIGSLDPVLAAPGIVQADTYLVEGETIRPVRLDGDRRGYVIAVGESSAEARERAEAAMALLEVEVEGAAPSGAESDGSA